jgi:hypothetical protein
MGTCATRLLPYRRRAARLAEARVSIMRRKSLLENLPTVGGTDLDLPGAGCGVSLM